MKKNSKGFTLIELLAVIVVLAIIMVIATTQVNKAIKGARKDSFIQSAKMVVKETQNRIIAEQMGNSEYKVPNYHSEDEYGLSKSDYFLYITKPNGIYRVVLKAVEGGKFDSINSFNKDDCEIKNASCGTDISRPSTGNIQTKGPYVIVEFDSNGNIITTTKQSS